MFLHISSLKSTRKNGLVFFSSPNTVGTVGSLRDRFDLTTSTLSIKSMFPGSTLNANFAFASVYSCALPRTSQTERTHRRRQHIRANRAYQYTIVSSGSARCFTRDPQNCSGVPSDILPQPKENMQSPTKTID